MAEKLVSGMQPEKYHDEYRDDLLALIEKRAKAGELNELPDRPRAKPRARKGAQVIDLMELLKQSVANKGNGSSKSNGASRARKPAKAKASSSKASARKSKSKSGPGLRKSA
jgi:DNA end-binding protein Ku